MANEVDISERWLLNACPKAVQALLVDHTTGQNIYWATESYSERGDGFQFFDHITIEKIKGDDVIVPRVRKSFEEQSRRVKDKAEVFTPAWICNAQKNLIDEAWFGASDVFNREFINEHGQHDWETTEIYKEFFSKPKSHKLKSWIQYVKDRRLEITCGEAPYLMSRYDAVSGKEIEPKRRIGMFDRKMQVINAFEDNSTKWMQRATDAIKASYGFEWQGDSLLLAREAMLLTVLDYFFDKYPEERPEEGSKYLNNGVIVKRQPFSKFINNAAYFISWNLWQMDGLKFVLPGSSQRIFVYDPTALFAPTPESVRETAEDILRELQLGASEVDQTGIPAVVCDWNHTKDEPRKVFFASLVKTDKNNSSQ
ncbi:MAG: restriction endonuclease subunit M [Muribaculum sp.]|nr:restriction endonuclease subunit M [Muribaculum sp.]